MKKAERFSNKTVEGKPVEVTEDDRRNDIEKRNAEAEKVCKKLASEGFIFEMSIPNESEIILKVGGRQFNFTKKIGTAERIGARIREFGK